jgi:hypothetical protein
VKHYTNPDFVRLISEVELQDGLYPMMECHAHEIDDLSCRVAPRPPMSTGCEEPALFEVAYDPGATVQVPTPILDEDDNPDAPMGRKKQRRDENGELEFIYVEDVARTPSDVLQTVTVCANDDLMRLWPRFQHVIRDPDPATGGR